MKIVFWNIGKKNNGMLIKTLLSERDIDIIILSEFEKLTNNTEFRKICKQLGYIYTVDSSCEKVSLLYKKNLCLKVFRGEHRFLLFEVNNILNDPILIAGIHLSAMEIARARRQKEISDLVNYILEEEKELPIDNTLVIGDFNANPFDEELVGHNYFNAVLYEDLMEKESIKWSGIKVKRFYNPILHYISENTKMYGSVYYHEENRPLYWNCLDQVIIRKPLLKYFYAMEYVRKIGDRSLVTAKGIVDSRYSDHLPLYVELDFKRVII